MAMDIIRESEKRTFKTKLKFIKLPKNQEFIPHITIDTSNGHIYGVRESENVPKKIVLVDKELVDTSSLIESVLYDVVITPFRLTHNNENYKAFIVKSATPALFDAEIYRPSSGSVALSFGNKTIIFAPHHKKPNYSDINLVMKEVNNRHYIKDKALISMTFHEECKLILKEYERKKRKQNCQEREKKHVSKRVAETVTETPFTCISTQMKLYVSSGKLGLTVSDLLEAHSCQQ